MSEWEGSFVELEEEELELISKTFANEACCWVAFEIRKALGDDVHQYGSFPGSHFTIDNPKTVKGAVSVHLTPISEEQLSVYCIHGPDREKILSPEEAVNYLLSI